MSVIIDSVTGNDVIVDDLFPLLPFVFICCYYLQVNCRSLPSSVLEENLLGISATGTCPCGRVIKALGAMCSRA